ncbi:hypothetical protein K8S19_09270 [bacterium]|nr:hypothetical protein [bacterium]
MWRIQHYVLFVYMTKPDYEGKMMNIRVWSVILIIACTAGQAIASDIFWQDTFDGLPGQQPAKWQDATDIQQPNMASIVYHQDGSHAMITPAGITTSAKIYSEKIYQCNVDIYNTLQINVSDISYTATQQWNICLEDLGNPGREFPLYPLSGAVGIFSFNFAHALQWQGYKDFRIRIVISDSPGAYLVVDEVKIFRNTTEEQVLWRDDLIGDAGVSVKNWWDREDDTNMGARIEYTAESSWAVVTFVENKGSHEDPWAEVYTPGIYWDFDECRYMEVKVSGFTENTACPISLKEIPTWDSIGVATITQPGIYLIDLLTQPERLWTGTALLTIAFGIEAPAEGASYTIDYVKIYKDNTQQDNSKTSITSPENAVFAVPNPFIPGNGKMANILFKLVAGYDSYTIKIMDVRGRLIRTLENEYRWDGRSSQGHLCEGGIYLFQVKSGNQRVHGSIVVIK